MNDRILVVTDAWRPQVNGVVRSLENVAAFAPVFGAELAFLTPEGFRTIALPTYPDIRLALTTPRTVAERIEAEEPDYIHIATEGPLGLLARRYCLRTPRPFTTSYHTRFPEYLAARAPVPTSLGYAFMRRFHNSGCGVMVATPSLDRELTGRGFQRIMRWGRGVDGDLFRPRPGEPVHPELAGLPRPIFLTVSRIAVEKNIEAFLTLDLPGAKVVIGDGPALHELRARHRSARFLGLRQGEELARLYSGADVFVFPSLTDTFGIVLLEALASGVPVAAFPVTGPMDVIGASHTGALDSDLRRACLAALEIDRARCRDYAMNFTWAASARQFVDNVRLANELVARKPGYARRMARRIVRVARRSGGRETASSDSRVETPGVSLDATGAS